MAAPLYLRDTRTAELVGLPGPLRDALAAWTARHQLTLDRVRAWRTHSVNPPGSGFLARLLGRRANPLDPDASHDAALVLLPAHLVEADACFTAVAAAVSVQPAQRGAARVGA